MTYLLHSWTYYTMIAPQDSHEMRTVSILSCMGKGHTKPHSFLRLYVQIMVAGENVPLSIVM